MSVRNFLQCATCSSPVNINWDGEVVSNWCYEFETALTHFSTTEDTLLIGIQCSDCGKAYCRNCMSSEVDFGMKPLDPAPTHKFCMGDLVHLGGCAPDSGYVDISVDFGKYNEHLLRP